MELTGAALVDHLQFLISGVEQQSAHELLRFLAGLPPRMWTQIRASSLLPGMIAACSIRPLDLAALVYLCTESPSTISAVTSACIQPCLAILEGDLCAVEVPTAPQISGKGSRIRKRRKMRLNEDLSNFSFSSVIRLPEDCRYADNIPSLLMGHSLFRASSDPSFARLLHHQPEFMPLIKRLINSDVKDSLSNHLKAFRLHKCLTVLENISCLDDSAACQKQDIIDCLLSWLEQVLLLEFELCFHYDSEHALLQSACSALRALTNLTNCDPNSCATFRRSKGVKLSVQILRLCEGVSAKSSAACDLTTIAVALLTNCAEADETTQKLLCTEPVLTNLFQDVSRSWEIDIDSDRLVNEHLLHCRTIAGYVSLLLGVIYLGCFDHRGVLARSCSMPLVAEILDQFACLTKLAHPEQTKMIAEITMIHRRLVSCTGTHQSKDGEDSARSSPLSSPLAI